MARNPTLAAPAMAVALAFALALPATAPAAAGPGAGPRNFSPALERVLEATRDYVDTADAPAKASAKSVTDAGCNPCWGEVARYTTFSTPQLTFDVQRYDGKEVVLLVPVDHPRKARVTPERLRTLVDRLDIL